VGGTITLGADAYWLRGEGWDVPKDLRGGEGARGGVRAAAAARAAAVCPAAGPRAPGVVVAM